MNGLEATVDAACSSCSKRLLELLFGKHKLMDHMSALRKYLLLEQGDFVQVLMDQLAEDLDRPASSLSLHHVICTSAFVCVLPCLIERAAKFETAVQSSNAQHESPDVLPRLMPRLLKVRGRSLSLFFLLTPACSRRPTTLAGACSRSTTMSTRRCRASSRTTTSSSTGRSLRGCGA